VKRVGHKGADLLAPGNTLDSFDAALAAGVDMIEFDVLPAVQDGDPADPGNPLVLAHDYRAAARVEPPTLEEGLAHLTGARFADIELDVDVKLPGYEERVVAALGDAGVLGRCIISCQYRSSLAALRRIGPELRLGWSVPRASRDYLRSPLYALPALAAMQAGRLVLPRLALAALRARRCDAVMAHWRLVSPALARAVRTGGGELYVWTVDDAERIRALAALPVTGVITNDPRLFDGIVPGSAVA
jgi:glycerophosphoryl diester phosphodiesterase